MLLFFFEAMVVPAAVLIGAYGGSDRKSAALNFAIYTSRVPPPMAIALWYILREGRFRTVRDHAHHSDASAHTQKHSGALPPRSGSRLRSSPSTDGRQIYAEAPCPLSAILTGVASKAGVFGFSLGHSAFPDGRCRE